MVEYQKKLVILCLIVARLTVVGQPGGGAWWKKYEATDYDEIMQEENTGWLTIGSKVFSKNKERIQEGVIVRVNGVIKCVLYFIHISHLFVYFALSSTGFLFY